MRVAILSDIHANRPALLAVLNDAKKEGITDFWCLGDVVGYGPWPIQCWKELEKLDISQDGWVVGNHDLGLIDGLDGGKYFNGYYFKDDAKKILTSHRQVCKQVPDIIEQIKNTKVISQPRAEVVLAHGHPKPIDVTWTVTMYTKKKSEADDAIEHLSKVDIYPKVIVVGHTHRAMFWRRMNDNNNETAWEEMKPEGIIALDLDSYIVYLNPGSVGQSRDEGREASYCYIDWHKKEVVFRRVPYRLELTRKKMEKLGYPETLIKMWYSGSCKWEEQ